MYLRNRPVYYTNGTETIAVHYTAVADELEEEGWTIVGEQKEDPAPSEESVPFEEELVETDLSDMTKAELLEYAKEIGVEIVGNKNKAEIVDLITEAENG
jgi:hypothetical protein